MKNKKEENISRRDFFKKSAQKVLPVLGVVALGSSNILSSCMQIDADIPDTPPTGGGGQGGCACGSNCSGTCYAYCAHACVSNCGNACTGCGTGCANTCKGGCKSAVK